jgi:Ankyrin repeats (3 copies)
MLTRSGGTFLTFSLMTTVMLASGVCACVRASRRSGGGRRPPSSCWVNGLPEAIQELIADSLSLRELQALSLTNRCFSGLLVWDATYVARRQALAHTPALAYALAAEKYASRPYAPGCVLELLQRAHKCDVAALHPGLRRTAMHFAAEAGNAALVEHLHRQGVSADAPTQCARRLTPLMLAIHESRGAVTDAIRALVLRLHADLDAADAAGNTAAHHAAACAFDPECLRFLVAHGSDLTARNAQRESVWHAARSAAAVDLLARHAPGLLECQRSGDQRRALAAAVQRDDLPVVERLLAHGADVHAVDSRGASAVSYARSTQVLELLAARGADVHHVTRRGSTVLHVLGESASPSPQVAQVGACMHACIS